jgi:probable HAF family extracellular repeat protein
VSATAFALCSSTAIFAAPTSPAPTAKPYSIQDLGELPNIADDVSAAINSKGEVAFWSKVGQNIHAVIWKNNQITDIGTQVGYRNSIAHALNSKGDVVGWMNTSNNPVDSLSTTRAFIVSKKRMRILDTLGGKNGRVLAINDSGAAVGDAQLASSDRHAFVTQNNTLKDLGTLPAGTFSDAFAISNTGIIAGVADTDGKRKHAVEWIDTKIIDLGALPGGTDSCARAVNDKGQVVGYSEMPDGYHAFLYTNGAMQDLGTLGSDPSMASAINSQGDVVGRSALKGYGHHAFIWSGGQITDLNTRISQDSGWILSGAYSINDKGQIVCTAYKKGLSTHLILLTP